MLNAHRQDFLQKRFRFILIQFVASSIYIGHCIFGFRLRKKNFHKKVIKKRRQTEYLFVNKVFNYEPTKFQNETR